MPLESCELGPATIRRWAEGRNAWSASLQPHWCHAPRLSLHHSLSPSSQSSPRSSKTSFSRRTSIHAVLFAWMFSDCLSHGGLSYPSGLSLNVTSSRSWHPIPCISLRFCLSSFQASFMTLTYIYLLTWLQFAGFVYLFTYVLSLPLSKCGMFEGRDYIFLSPTIRKQPSHSAW